MPANTRSSVLPKEISKSSVKPEAVKNDSSSQPKTAKTVENTDASIHLLKSKIEQVENKLPRYSRFESYVVESFEEKDFQTTIRGLNKQKIEVSKARNEVSSMCIILSSTHRELIDQYKDNEFTELTERLNKLENERNITGLISSLESLEATLTGLVLEIDMTIACEKDLQAMTQDSTTINQSETVNTKISGIKLTDVEVPTFDGTGENFIEFLSSYDQLVHRNDKLSEIEKCIRLKQCLKERAALCIKGIPVTGENYSIMYSKLKRKFENASVNKHAIVEKLENLPESGEITDECMNTLSEIEVILNQLECAKMSINDSTNLLFHRLILSKFPNYIVESVVEKTKNDEFTVDDLMQSLENVIFTKNFCQKAMKNNRVTRVQEQSHHNRSEHSNRFRKAVSNENNRNLQLRHDENRIADNCVFCPSGDHTTDECNIPWQAKKDILNENKACWKCFKTNHGSYKCRLPNCACGGLHHLTMCKDRSSVRNQTDSTPGNRDSVQFQPDQVRNNSMVPSFQAHPVILVDVHDDISPSGMTDENLQAYTKITSNNTIPTTSILMTCSAPILNPVNDQHAEATTLFDSGSQRTLISEKYATSMNLKIIGNEQYVVSGINGDSDIINGNIVEIRMKDVEGREVVLHALTKEFICQQFNAAKLDENDLKFASKNSINIANSHIKGETICPDILIGVDCYNRLVKNVPRIELPSGLRIVETLIGNCVFGVANNPDNEKKVLSTYANYSCVVKIITNRSENNLTKSTKDAWYNHNSVVKNANSGKKYIRKSKEKRNRRKPERIILPRDIISLLKKRAASRRKARTARITSLLKTRRQMQRNINKPIGVTNLINHPDQRKTFLKSFLKKNKKDPRIIQTLNSCVERALRVSTQIETDKVKAKANRIEKVVGKFIH